jgi:hypothetical protein
MPLVLTGSSVRFEDVCTVEDAMEFIGYLRTSEMQDVDLSGCTYLHTALLQLLLRAKPHILAAAEDPFLARWSGLVSGVAVSISEREEPVASALNG